MAEADFLNSKTCVKLKAHRPDLFFGEILSDTQVNILDALDVTHSSVTEQVSIPSYAFGARFVHLSHDS